MIRIVLALFVMPGHLVPYALAPAQGATPPRVVAVLSPRAREAL